MKTNENKFSRRKFFAIGASSAAVLIGGKVMARQPKTTERDNAPQTITHHSVAAMQADHQLKAGDTVHTLGYHQVGDDGGNVYIVLTDSQLPADGGSVIQLSQQLKAKAVFPGGRLMAEQYGVIADSSSPQVVANNSAAMIRAHQSGKVVHYHAKAYYFDRIDLSTGGINGQGSQSRLISTNTSDRAIIRYQGNGVIFKDFSLLAASDKTQGAGIELKGNNEFHSDNIQNVNFEQLPTGIRYLSGNLSIDHNRIVGGDIGIEISPQANAASLKITNNSLSLQNKHGIGYIGTNGVALGQLQISQNQITADSTDGAAILIQPQQHQLNDLSVNNNQISFSAGKTAKAAIVIAQSNRFMVNNNSINCNAGQGYRGIYINQDCSNGILSANHVSLPMNGHSLNLSVTTTEV